jgi:hypothetical protein
MTAHLQVGAHKARRALGDGGVVEVALQAQPPRDDLRMRAGAAGVSRCD